MFLHFNNKIIETIMKSGKILNTTQNAGNHKLSYHRTASASSSSSSSECSAHEQVLHCKRRNLGCSSAEGSSYTANSETKSAVLPVWLTGSSGLHRNSQEVNISSIRDFDQIRDSEIPITLRPLKIIVV